MGGIGMMRDAGYEMLDAGYEMLDARQTNIYYS